MPSDRLSVTPKQEQHITGKEEQERLTQAICERVRPLRPAKRRVSWNEVMGWVEVE